MAAAALAGCGDATSFGPLVRALGDTDPAVRGTARRVLGATGDSRAVAPLLAALAALPPVPSWERYLFAVAVATLDPARAVPPLLALLDAPEKVTRSHAAARLGDYGDARALPALAALRQAGTRDDGRLDELGVMAARAIAAIERRLAR